MSFEGIELSMLNVMWRNPAAVSNIKKSTTLDTQGHKIYRKTFRCGIGCLTQVIDIGHAFQCTYFILNHGQM